MTTLAPLSPIQTQNDSHSFNAHTEYSSSNLLNLLRSQIEYYFSPQNLLTDTYLNSVMATNQGRAPISLIVTFPKIQQLYNSHSPTEDCCSLLAKAMVNSHLVHVDGPFLYPSVSTFPSESTPKRFNAANKQFSNRDNRTDSIVNPCVSSAESTCSASTHEELEWAANDGTNKYSKNSANSNTVTTCSPTSFEDDTIHAVTSLTDDNDNLNETGTKTASCEQDLNVGLNDLVIDTSNGHLHSPLLHANNGNPTLMDSHQPASIDFSGRDHQQPAPTTAYPMMTTFAVDPFYLPYYYPQHYYYPYQQIAIPSTVINSNHQPEIRTVVTDPFYYYNMYHNYQYAANLPPQMHHSHVEHAVQQSHHYEVDGTIENSVQSLVVNNNSEKEIPKDDCALPDVVFVSPSPTPSVATMKTQASSIKQPKKDQSSEQQPSQSNGSSENNNKKSSRLRRNNNHHNNRIKGSKDQQGNIADSNNTSNRKSKQTSCMQTSVASCEHSKDPATATKKKKNKRISQKITSHYRRGKSTNSDQIRQHEKQILSEENFPALVPMSSPPLKIPENVKPVMVNADLLLPNTVAPEHNGVISCKKTGYAEAVLKQQAK